MGKTVIATLWTLAMVVLDRVRKEIVFNLTSLDMTRYDIAIMDSLMVGEVIVFIGISYLITKYILGGKR
jgi:hypothetical protein